MGKLNRTGKTRPTNYENHPEAKRNYEDGLTFAPDLETELYIRVLGCLWCEPRFYGNTESRGEPDGPGEAEAAIVNLAMTLDPEYVLKLAVYAREQMHLRTVPQVLLVCVANRPDLAGHPKPYVSRYGPRIMARLDEVMEAMAYQLSAFGKPIPNSLRKAVTKRLQSISEYEALKYRKTNADVSLVDVINLVHPKPIDEYRRAIFKWIVTGEVDEEIVPQIASWMKLSQCTEFDDYARRLALTARPTWEFLVSKFGSSKEVWEAAELPYMATLRNLRNLIRAGVDIGPALKLITDQDAIANSKLYPFRFVTAHSELEYAAFTDVGNSANYNRAMLAVEQALETSITNLQRLPGRTLVMIDTSGSMFEPVSRKGLARYVNVALTLGAIATSICDDCKVLLFGTDYTFVNLETTDTVMQRVKKMLNFCDRRGTNPSRAMEHVTQRRMVFERIIMLSDMQIYSEEEQNQRNEPVQHFANYFDDYRRVVNPKVKMVSVNMAGYNDLPVPQEQTMLLSGWSERIFDLVAAWEKDPRTAVEHVREYVDNSISNQYSYS